MTALVASVLLPSCKLLLNENDRAFTSELSSCRSDSSLYMDKKYTRDLVDNYNNLNRGVKT
jgi:hypothetical protein